MHQLPIQHDAERSQSTSAKHSVLVDTDIGDDIDDAIALALILQSPEIDLQGISTVYGDTRQRARLAQYLLHVFGREDVCVAAGVEAPIQPRHRPSPPTTRETSARRASSAQPARSPAPSG